MKISDTLNIKIQERFIYWGVHDILDADDTAQLTEEIISLFREIAKEAIKPMDYAENVLDKNANNLEISLYNQRKEGYNRARSEILSNIEKVI